MIPQIITIALLAISASSQECLAIALAGGGSNGGYEAAVLFGFANSTKAPNIKYQVVSGVSIGAINGGLVTQYPIGQELSMSQQMLALWRIINGTSDIFVEWDGGLVEGLLFQRGFFNNTPGIDLTKTYIFGPRTRNYTVGSTNLNLGIFQTLNETFGNQIIDEITCSSSIPAFFPPHIYQGTAWADGGCIDNLDVFSAIERCLEVVETEKQVTVDMIYCDNYGALPNETKLKTLDVLARVYLIHGYDSSVWYTYNAQVAFPNVNYRYIVAPSEPMQSLLNFTRPAIEYDIQLGFNDSAKILNSNASGKTIITELFNKVKNDVIYP